MTWAGWGSQRVDGVPLCHLGDLFQVHDEGVSVVWTSRRVSFHGLSANVVSGSLLRRQRC